MESKKILAIWFLTVSTILFSGCRAQNANYGFGNVEGKYKQCKCEWNAGTKTVPDILLQYHTSIDVHHKHERQIIYLYRDVLQNIITIHIPNRDKQKLIPDAPIENDDVLLIANNETVRDLFFNNPGHVTSENTVPQSETTKMNNILKVPEKDRPQNKHVNEPNDPDYINYEDLQIPVEYFETVKPIGFKPYSGLSYLDYIKKLDVPVDLSEDLWPSSHTKVPNLHAIHPSKIKPIYSDEQEPEYSGEVSRPRPLRPSDTKPINYVEEKPEYSGEVPHLRPLRPSDTKPMDSTEQEPEYSGEVPHSQTIHPSDTKPIDFVEEKPEYFEEEPHPRPLHPSNINPVDSGEQEPENSGKVPHPKPLHPSYNYPIDSDEEKPEYSGEVPHPRPLHPSNINLVDSGEQVPENSGKVPHPKPLHPSYNYPIDSDEEKPEYSGDVPHPHPLYPSNINPVDSGEQESENSGKAPHPKPLHPSYNYPIDSDEEKPEYSGEVPHPRPLHPSNINPVDSGEQESENSGKVPHPKPLHPSYNYLIDSDEEKPEYSGEVPHPRPLHPSNINPVDSGEQEPENSGQVPHPKTLHPSYNYPIDSDEEKPEYSGEVPHQRPLHPSNINPIDSGEQESENSGKVPHPKPLHSSYNYLIDSDEEKPEYSGEVSYLRPLHPSNINPVDSGEQEPENSGKVPHPKPLHPSYNYPIHSDEQKPEYSREVPHPRPLHPSNINPVDSGEQESENSEKVPHPNSLHPNHNYPIVSDEYTPEYSGEVPHPQPLHTSNINPVYSDEQELEYSGKIPRPRPLHLSDTKPIDSDKEKPEYSGKVSRPRPLRPSDTKPIDSSEQEPEYYREVPHPQPLYPSNINPIYSDEQEPEYSGEVPRRRPLHPYSIKPLNLFEKDPGQSVNIAYPFGMQRYDPKIDFYKYRLGNTVVILRPKYSQIQKPCHKCNPLSHYKIKLPPYSIRDQYPGALKWPIKSTTNGHPKVHYKIPMTGLPKKHKIRTNSLFHMGYKTFDQWFREEMNRFRDSKQKVNVDSVGHFILKILYENGMFVTNGGVLKDPEGRILYLQNLKLRPILIGDPMNLDKFFGKGSNSKRITNHPVSTWSEFVILTKVNPPRTLGIIPLGTTYLPSSSALHPLSALYPTNNNVKYHFQIARKKQHKEQSSFHLLPQNVKSRYKRHQYLGPIKTTEPGNPSIFDNELIRNLNTQVSKASDVKDDKSIDESVENFLRNMPVYSYRRKFYVDRKDLSKDEQLLKDALVDISKTPLKRRSSISNKHDNLYSDKLVKIAGGVVAPGSSSAFNNERKLDDSLKVHFLPRNHESLNQKKNRDYLNKEDFYDDSLIRIIGGNAATGSGSPLSYKGRSGAPK